MVILSATAQTPMTVHKARRGDTNSSEHKQQARQKTSRHSMIRMIVHVLCHHGSHAWKIGLVARANSIMPPPNLYNCNNRGTKASQIAAGHLVGCLPWLLALDLGSDLCEAARYLLAQSMLLTQLGQAAAVCPVICPKRLLCLSQVLEFRTHVEVRDAD